MVGIYSLASFIHNKEIIEKESRDFLNQIELNSNIVFHEVDSLDEEDLTLIFVRTGGVENKFKELKEKSHGPYFILSYNFNNSLAASMEILSYLKDKGELAEIIHGDIKYIVKKITELEKIMKAVKSFKGVNMGIIGNPSDWLIASEVDKDLALNKLGINLLNIPIEKLYETSNTCSSNSYVAHLLEDDTFSIDEKKKSLSVLGNMEELIKEYNLKALTVRCFDLLSTIHTTSCMALAVLNSLGIPSTCEGDVPMMISMYISNLLFDNPGFQVNPSEINPETNEIIFAHCTAPLKMLSSYKYDTHFESGIGIAIKGELKEEDVLIFKISKDLNRFYLSKAKIIENLNRDNLCRTQVRVRLDKNVEYFLNNPLGNHHLIINNANEKYIKDFFKYAGIEIEEI